MKKPEIPSNEQLRQAAVDKYLLLDTLPEENYDNITRLAAMICDTPISLVTLLDYDRNYLKSHLGVEISESPRDISFCGHAINSDSDIMIIPDAREDERFHDNPLVSEFQAIFYAGVPLVDPQGLKLGTLCVYDHVPRNLKEDQIKALKGLARQIMNLFESHYQNLVLKKMQERLTERNEELDKFAALVSHDIKSPLSNIISLTDLLESDNKGTFSDHSAKCLQYIQDSSRVLKDYIDGILEYYKSETAFVENRDEVGLHELLNTITEMLNPDGEINILLPKKDAIIRLNKSALMQILMNILSNAIAHNPVENLTIEINFWEEKEDYKFSIKDNGNGIPEEIQANLFHLFVKAPDSKGTGIGMATVRRTIDNMFGTIGFQSELGKSTEFTFTLPRESKEILKILS